MILPNIVLIIYYNVQFKILFYIELINFQIKKKIQPFILIFYTYYIYIVIYII